MKINENAPSNSIYYSAVAVVILFSFFSFSYSYYPLFNADAALSVLMAYDYHFPKDLYCWGQNRGGTPEMLIAHFFISTLHSGPLITSSIIHYLLLSGGLLASFHFVRKPFLRLALTIAWFFPSYFFIESVIYQFGIQFSMFMVGLFFFSKTIGSKKQKSLLLSLSLFFMLVNVWVLDLGLITVLFLAFMVAVVAILRKKKPALVPAGLNELFSLKNCLISTVWISAGILFISYAKINAAAAPGFAELSINNAGEIYRTAASFLKTFLASFVLQRRPVESVYFYSAIIFFLLFIFRFRRKKEKHSSVDFFRLFFLGQSVFGILLLLCSKQVLITDVPVRYFGGVYLSFILYILMKLETIEINPLLSVGLSIVLTASVASTIYESYFPEKRSPMVKNFPLLNSYEHVGIIGSYWNSYVFAAIDPEKIKATPHDQDYVRNQALAYETLEQPTLLLIQNEWLEKFPDSISQFGTPLLKKGNPFLLGTYISWNEVNDVVACEYIRR